MAAATTSQIIGAGIAWLREQKGISQRQVGLKAGISNASVAAIEHGGSVSLDRLDRISRVFGISLGGLIQIAEELHEREHPSIDFPIASESTSRLLDAVRRGR